MDLGDYVPTLGDGLPKIPGLPDGTTTAISLVDRLFGSPISNSIGKITGDVLGGLGRSVFGGKDKHSVSFGSMNLNNVTPGNFTYRQTDQGFGPILNQMGAIDTNYRTNAITRVSMSLIDPAAFTVKGLRDFAKLSGEKLYSDLADNIHKQRLDLFAPGGTFESKQQQNQRLLDSMSVAEDVLSQSLNKGLVPGDIAKKFYIDRDLQLTQSMIDRNLKQYETTRDSLGGKSLVNQKESIISRFTGSRAADMNVLNEMAPEIIGFFGGAIDDPRQMVESYFDQKLSGIINPDEARVYTGPGGNSPYLQLEKFMKDSASRLEMLKRGELPTDSPFSTKPKQPSTGAPSQGQQSSQGQGSGRGKTDEIADAILDIFRFLNSKRRGFDVDDSARVNFGFGDISANELDDLRGFGNPLGFAAGKKGTSTGVSGAGSSVVPLEYSQLQQLQSGIA